MHLQVLQAFLKYALKKIEYTLHQSKLEKHEPQRIDGTRDKLGKD